MSTIPLLNTVEMAFCIGGELRADRGALHRAADSARVRNRAQVNLAAIAHCSVKDDAPVLRKGRKLTTKNITVKKLERVAVLLAARHDSLSRGVAVVRSSQPGCVDTMHGSKFIAKWLPLRDHLRSNESPVDVMLTSAQEWENLTERELDIGFRFEWKAHSSRSLLSVRHKPLWRLVVNVVSDDKFDVIVVASHAVMDGTSATVVLHDVVQALNATLVKKSGFVSFEANFVRDGYRSPDVFTALYGAPHLVGTKVRLLGAFGRLIGRHIQTLAKPTWLVDQLLSGIPARLSSRMAYSDVIDGERWRTALRFAKERGVRPQALLIAVGVALEAVYVMLRDKKKNSHQKEGWMAVAIRSDDRVRAGHVHAQPTDVQHTAAMVNLGTFELHRTDLFWNFALSIQELIEKTLAHVDSTRNGTALMENLLCTVCCRGTGGLPLLTEGLTCINLGRSYHFGGSNGDADKRFSHLRVDCAHFAESMFSADLGDTIGTIWPLDIDGNVTFQLEYCPELWSPEDAKEILHLYVETLLDSQNLDTIDALVEQAGRNAMHNVHRVF